MKKILVAVLAVVTLVGCGDHSKIEKQIKSTIKKEAKLNGVSVRFNSIEIEDSDTIPYYYLGFFEVMDLELEAKTSLIHDSFNLKDALDDYRESRKEFGNASYAQDLYDSYENLIESTNDCIAEDWKLIKEVEESYKKIEKESHSNKCYIVYCDYLCKVGNLPVRVQPTYVFVKENGKFKCIYEPEKFQDLIK